MNEIEININGERWRLMLFPHLRAGLAVSADYTVTTPRDSEALLKRIGEAIKTELHWTEPAWTIERGTASRVFRVNGSKT